MIKKPLYRTKTMTISEGKKHNLSQYPNAGPYCNITGMKNKYWGIDALCIKCGVYVYKVPREIYDLAH